MLEIEEYFDGSVTTRSFSIIKSAYWPNMMRPETDIIKKNAVTFKHSDQFMSSLGNKQVASAHKYKNTKPISG